MSPDWALDGLFYGLVGPGWVAGDATYSTAMPGHREAFVFSDTVIGTASAYGGASVSGVAANSELVGRPPDLRSAYGGSYLSPAPLIPDSRHAGDKWEVGATLVTGGHQFVFVNEFDPVPGSQFGRFTGRSGLAELTAPASGNPRFQRVVGLPTGRRTQWGNALVVRRGVAYVYGVDDDTTTGTFGGMTLARVRVADIARPGRWRYWDGRRWRRREADVSALATGQALTGVALQPGRRGLVAVSIPGGVTHDGTVDLSYACDVTGPWSSPVPVYAIPQLLEYQDETAYMATFHPELSVRGSLVVSYDIDTTDGLFAVAEDVHRYQPQFLIVRL